MNWHINLYTEENDAAPHGFTFRALCADCAARLLAVWRSSGNANEEACEVCGDGQRLEE